MPNPSDPQSLNRYSYVLNNPLKYIDPSGHRTCGSGANPLDETCDENMDNPGYGDDGPDATDKNNWPIKPARFKFFPGTSGCDALSGTSTPCRDLGVVEKTIIGGFLIAPVALPYLIEFAPAWYVEYVAAGKIAATGGGVLAACGGDCSEEISAAAEEIIAAEQAFEQLLEQWTTTYFDELICETRIPWVPNLPPEPTWDMGWRGKFLVFLHVFGRFR